MTCMIYLITLKGLLIIFLTTLLVSLQLKGKTSVDILKTSVLRVIQQVDDLFYQYHSIGQLVS